MDQIIELAMDISDDNHWFLHSKNVRLLSHDCRGSFDNLNELFLLQSTLSKQMLSKFINVGNCTVATLAFSLKMRLIKITYLRYAKAFL